ncbi:EAL domain-containing protein [Alkalihalobacillus sp. MEB130]|uniref:bifunctional diguanylate cyclase/phosphodiesterase n=1 Tax=Alkalihalobacillus sp. MEB130 TaxID=2976704 RepID=UPI0028DDEAF9|nr:GGDEF domain-containing protein [Alkalihalobacillus sp. MEB130]MDT8861122.1 EAL domain-containing protein [Alkalihalobacillus sp. MEB130]
MMEGRNETLHWQNEIVGMLAANKPLSSILKTVVASVELQLHGAICSISLYNQFQNKLERPFSLNLSDEYLMEINGLEVGPNAGSCGTAVYKRQTTIVSNIETNSLWDDYRTLANKHHLKSCWSIPIFSPTNNVLGTFALYFKENREATGKELAQLEQFAQLCGIAIDYKHTKEEMYTIKHIDSLTGLANASQFKREAKQAIDQAKKENKIVSFLFIDLNRFNLINNIGGYDAGDKVLKEVTKRLVQHIPPTALLTRWNSDKFIILYPNTTAEKMKQNSEQIIELLSTPVQWEEHDFILTSSIGISSFPLDSENVDDLIKHSESAMNDAKLKGMNQVRRYSPSMDNQLSNRLLIEKELRQAITTEDFVLHYQSQVTLTNNEMVGVEALVRWSHPTMGMISPASFIPIAEETGLIIPLGEWVLRTACQQMKQWEQEGLPPIRLSVNLSSVQLRQRNLIDKVKEILEETEIDPSRLVLEVTESTLVSHMQYTISQLRALQAMGIQIALDDFGTLYSSLSYLKHFPLDIIKIDRSFVHTLLSDAKDIKIVNTIIQLGKHLKLKVLAEGIETRGQAELLQQHHCHEGQGYLFSKPVPIETLKNAIQSKQVS